MDSLENYRCRIGYFAGGNSQIKTMLRNALRNSYAINTAHLLQIYLRKILSHRVPVSELVFVSVGIWLLYGKVSVIPSAFTILVPLGTWDAYPVVILEPCQQVITKRIVIDTGEYTYTFGNGNKRQNISAENTSKQEPLDSVAFFRYYVLSSVNIDHMQGHIHCSIERAMKSYCLLLAFIGCLKRNIVVEKIEFENDETVHLTKNLKKVMAIDSADYKHLKALKETCKTERKLNNDLRTWMYRMDRSLMPRSNDILAYPLNGYIIQGTVHVILNRYFSANPPTKRETMAYELLRLCTLHDFPKSTGQSCIRLAQAGFFYEGKDDEVTCFSCSIQISGWQPLDIPMDRHSKTSLNCLFIKCQNSGNVPISSLGSEAVGETAIANEKSGNTNCESCSRKEIKDDSGFVTELSNVTQSSTSNLSVPQTSGASNDSGYSSQSSSSSHPGGSSSISNNQTYITTSRTGISDTQTASQYTITSTNRNRAHYPEYVLVNDRLRSFDRGWPDYVSQTPQMMVESGFFFAGYDDCVRCFQCGIGLRNWEPPDSPHVEHARWSPKCPFLLGVKGQDFINLVLDAVAQLAIRNEQIASDPPAHMESNPGKAVLLQTSQQIQQRSTTSRNLGTSAQADAAGSVNTSSQANASSTNTDSSQSKLGTEEAKKVLKKGFSENEVRKAVEKIVEKDGWSKVTEERVLKTIQEEKQNERLHPPGLRGGEANVKDPALAPDIAELKKKNREMREMTICKICLEEEVSIVFLPCGHLVACAQCAPALSRCAVCRKPITGTICAHLDV